MTTTDRQYDVLVWGATGVAGRLVAEHLTDRYTPDELALALGGRSEDRLAAVAEAFTGSDSEWDDLPLVLGDATDPERLREIAEQTQVVCTTVGPYTTYGSGMVAACAGAGTDYCDLTGEVNWVREMVDRYHETAVANGARILNSCGFDSVPTDLGTAVVQEHALEAFDAPCDVVRVYLEAGDGGVSGGTLASFAELFDEVSSDPIARQTLENPYSLAPPGDRDGVDPGEQTGPRRDGLREEWTGPSPMAVVNERIVRRSNALLDYPWGREFRCTESIPTGDGVGGAAAATGLSAGMGVATTALSVDPVREAVREYVFPDQGEGPTAEEAKEGRFEIGVLGRGTATDGQFVVEGTFAADRGPGYGATAQMLGESAMALLRDDTDSPLSGGVLTPASGIGTPLAGRLRDVGFEITAETRT